MLVKPIPVAEMLFARTVQMELIVALVRKATRVILSEDVLTLMNVAADLSMVVASAPPA